MLHEGGRLYFQEGRGHGSFAGGFQEQVFDRTWGEIIRSGRGKVWATFRNGRITGALSALKQADFYNADLIAGIVFWYVIPKERGNSRQAMRLMNCFERWAREIGARRLAVGHLRGLMPDKFERFYARLGYRLNELHYMKELLP